MEQELVMLQEQKLKPLPMVHIKPSELLFEAYERNIKQYFGSFIKGAVNKGAPIEVCAYGAMAIVLGGHPDRTSYNIYDAFYFKHYGSPSAVDRALDVPRSTRENCPHNACSMTYRSPGDIIMHMNDKHKNTFKEIATWLQSVGL